MTPFDNDPRVQVDAWGSNERDVTYRVAAEHVPANPPSSDLNWGAYRPGNAIVVQYIQDGGYINGWVVSAEDNLVSRRLTSAAYISAEAALRNVLGDPR
jgi:hypothetical protein